MLGLGLSLINNINIVSSLQSDPAFTIVVDTTQAGSASDTFVLPLDGTSTYNFDIDWGDGNTETVTVNTDQTHVYSASGTYTIKITGTFPRIYFNNGGDKDKLMYISNWGDIIWSSMGRSFYGCINLDVIANDTPNLSNVTDMLNMFRGCGSLLNADVSNFDTSNVIDMRFLFNGCTFYNPDVSNWNIESCTDMDSMFLSSGFSNENYNKLLVAWEAQNEQPNVTFHAGSAQYSAGAPATARANLVASGWSITDGGLAP